MFNKLKVVSEVTKLCFNSLPAITEKVENFIYFSCNISK